MKYNGIVYVEKCLDKKLGVWAIVQLAALHNNFWSIEIYRTDRYGDFETVGYKDRMPIKDYTDIEAYAICDMLQDKFKGNDTAPWPIFKKAFDK
jgi:hypothetical protein